MSFQRSLKPLPFSLGANSLGKNLVCVSCEAPKTTFFGGRPERKPSVDTPLVLSTTRFGEEALGENHNAAQNVDMWTVFSFLITKADVHMMWPGLGVASCPDMLAS